MRLSTRVILVTAALLAVIIVGMVIVTRLQLPWLWPTEKWPDFWIALISAMIAIATIGAIATFFVERILKDLEEQRAKRQLKAQDEREWEEFERLLYSRLLEELPFWDDIDYTNMAIPHNAAVIAHLLATVPLTRWQQELSLPHSLISSIRLFSTSYSFFKTSANTLLQVLRKNIDQYNRNQFMNGHPLDPSEDKQLTFCLGLIVKNYEVVKKHDDDIAKAENEYDKQLIEMHFKSEKDDEMKQAAADILWHLRLSEAVLPDLLKLYDFVTEKISALNIDSYGSERKQLVWWADDIRDQVFNKASQDYIDDKLKETEELVAKMEKQKGVLNEHDRQVLDRNLSYLHSKLPSGTKDHTDQTPPNTEN